MKVFLGGSCEGRDWRNELIPKLKCEYFNPCVLDIDKFDSKMKNSLEEVKNMIRRNGSKVCDTLDQIAFYLNRSNL